MAKSNHSAAGGSRSLGGKITDAILGRANKDGQMPRDLGREPKASKRSMQEKGIGGRRLGHKGGGRKKT